MKNLIEKAIAKATGQSENRIAELLTFPDKVNIDMKEAKEAIQWAVDERTNDILGALRESLDDMNSPKDLKHTYGFQLAIDIVNDNFFE